MSFLWPSQTDPRRATSGQTEAICTQFYQHKFITSHTGDWKKAPVGLGLSLRSATALGEVGGINKNVGIGRQEKKLRL